MDLQDKLAELISLVEGARAMPMSASCIVNRGQVLDMLEEARRLVPEQMKEAESLLRDREDVIAEGRREAEQIIAAAHEERARLLSDSEVYREAAASAERLVADSAQEARAMREEVDDYVDAKLANFEIVLNKTLAAVLRGRERLRGRDEMESLADEPNGDETPLPGLPGDA